MYDFVAQNSLVFYCTNNYELGPLVLLVWLMRGPPGSAYKNAKINAGKI